MEKTLKGVSIDGFKSIRRLDNLELGRLNILIGANGSGKSNFISFFSMLSEMLKGKLQIYVGNAGGPAALLYRGRKHTRAIGAELHFGVNRYRFELEPTADNRLMFTTEKVYFAGVYEPEEDPWSALGDGHFEARLPYGARTARRSVTNYIASSNGDWRVHHFHDTSETAGLKQPGPISDHQRLRPDAGNLAAFLFRLKHQHAAHFEAIRDAIRQVAPFFDDFQLEPTVLSKDRIELEWTERDSDVPMKAHQLSDGTLRFMCIAALLLQPEPPTTIIVDEPELGLHPYAISVLAGLLRSTATRVQVIVSTQSVPLVNEFEAEDLIVVDREDNHSVFRRPNATALKDWLDEYSLGELWEKNVLGGRPSR